MLKRILWIFLFTFLMLNVNTAFSATRTWDGGSVVDNLWSTKENWSADTVPVDGDDVLFDATTTDPCTIDVAVNLGLGDITGDAAYQGTITQSSAVTCTDIILNGPGWTGTANVTCSGNFTVGGSTVSLGGTCSITGALSRTSGSLTLSSGNTTVAGGVSGTFTHNSGTVVLSDTQTVNTGSSFNNLTLGGADGKTLTLSADCTVTGTFTCSYDWTSNGNNIYWQGHITGTSGKEIGGTTAITINGGANQTWTGNGGQVRNNLTINKSGNTLSLIGTIVYTDGTLTYTAGTVDASTGTSTLQVFFENTKTCTLTTDGIDWYNVNFKGGGAGGTITLGSDLSIDGTLTLNPSNVVNGNEIYLSGSLVATGEILTGSTTKLIFDGTGTWSGTAAVRCNVDINTAGTLTLSGTIRKTSNTIAYVAGTLNAGTSTFQISGASIDLPSGSVSLNNFTPLGTCTLLSNLDVNGDLDLTVSLGANTIKGFQINVAGDITFGSVGYIESVSTTQIVYDGTGIWSSAGGGKLGAKFTINTLGTLTVSGAVYYDNTFIYTAGTVVTTGSTLNLTTTTSLDSDGISWDSVNVNAGTTTLAGALDVNGDLTIGGTLTTAGNQINCAGNFDNNSVFTHGNGAVVFDGSGTSIITGANTFYDLTCITPSKALSFESGVTQTIAHTLTLNGQANGTKVVLNRSGGTGTDRFTFDCTAPQAVTYVDVTNSNSSTSSITATKSKNLGNTDSAEAAPHWVIQGGGQVISVS